MSKKVLLGIYGIVPLCIAVILVDHFLLGRFLAERLPRSPEQLLIFTVIFNLPHIFASSVEFLDSEYIRSYKNKLLIGIASIILGTIFIPMIIGREPFLVLFAIYTIYHVIGQQFGLARMSLARVDGWYDAWKWLGIFVATLVYIAIYPPEAPGIDLEFILPMAAAGLSVPWFFIALRVAQGARSRKDSLSIWANQLMVYFAIVSFFMGYPFFAVLAPRVIHDVTAFAFYIVHDQNRRQVSQGNWLFSRIPKSVPAYVFTPVVAMALAFPLTYYEEAWSIGWMVTVALGSFHYFTEKLVWKMGTPHRAHIKFKN